MGGFIANTRNGNTFYIDTAYTGASDSLIIKNVRVIGVLITATAANAVLLLKDESVVTKLDLRSEISGKTLYFDFANTPINFPNGIRPVTVTNCVATLIVEESRS